MPMTLGTDIVEVGRIKRAIQKRGEFFLRRIFTSEEAAYCLKKRNPYPYFAGRFAAKEAFFKAAGIGIDSKIPWVDIEVCREKGGKPYFCLKGKALWFLQERGNYRLELSISHTEHFAIAVVSLIYGGKRGEQSESCN